MNRPHLARTYQIAGKSMTVNGKTYRLTPKKIKWLERFMKHGDGIKAAMEAYNPGSHGMAKVISSKNQHDPTIIALKANITEKACGTILSLSEGAKNEGVRLNASKDILDRLGYKATENIVIDDRRELTQEDRNAIDSVLSILNPKAKEAVIVEEDAHERTTS